MEEGNKRYNMDMPGISRDKAEMVLREGTRNTLRFRRWLAEYVKTGKATEAVRKAYGTKNNATAHTIASDNLRKLDFPAFLELMGVSDHKIVKRLSEGLDATKWHTSHTEPDKEVADYGTRHKYLETALKLKGRLQDTPPVVVVDKALVLDGLTADSTPVIEGEQVG